VPQNPYMKRSSYLLPTIMIGAFVFAVSGALISARADSAALSTLAKPLPTPVRTQARTADAEFKRLLRLRDSLAKIPVEKIDRQPHKSFIKANRKDIVYSEPAGQWLVRSDLFWNLRNKYKALPIADDIAWAAAENPLPGECEGDINCYIYTNRVTLAQYLSFYPNGKSAKKALAEIIEELDYIVEDLNGKKGNYVGPDDKAGRDELAKRIAEMRVILSKVTAADRAKVISQLATIGEAFR